MKAPATVAGDRMFEVLDLSSRMLEQARAGRWDRVQEIQARRWTLLRNGLPERLRVRDMEEILALDLEIEQLARKAKAETAAELRHLHQGRQAHLAYGGA